MWAIPSHKEFKATKESLVDLLIEQRRVAERIAKFTIHLIQECRFFQHMIGNTCHAGGKQHGENLRGSGIRLQQPVNVLCVWCAKGAQLQKHFFTFLFVFWNRIRLIKVLPSIQKQIITNPGYSHNLFCLDATFVIPHLLSEQQFNIQPRHNLSWLEK